MIQGQSSSVSKVGRGIALLTKKGKAVVPKYPESRTAALVGLKGKEQSQRELF